MFTSIANLRSSPAQQDRVEKVFKWLKKQVPTFTPETYFPIFLIAESNTMDDFQWVANRTGTHADASLQRFGSSFRLDSFKPGFDVDEAESKKATKELLARLEIAVTEKLGKVWVWQSGLFINDADERVFAPTAPSLDAPQAPTPTGGTAAWPFPTGTDQRAAATEAVVAKTPKVKTPKPKKEKAVKPVAAKKAPKHVLDKLAGKKAKPAAKKVAAAKEAKPVPQFLGVNALPKKATKSQITAFRKSLVAVLNKAVKEAKSQGVVMSTATKGNQSAFTILL